MKVSDIATQNNLIVWIEGGGCGSDFDDCYQITDIPATITDQQLEQLFDLSGLFDHAYFDQTVITKATEKRIEQRGRWQEGIKGHRELDKVTWAELVDIVTSELDDAYGEGEDELA